MAAAVRRESVGGVSENRRHPVRRTNAGHDVVVNSMSSLLMYVDKGWLDSPAMLDYAEGRVAVASEHLDAPLELVEQAEEIIMGLRDSGPTRERAVQMLRQICGARAEAA